MKQPQICADGEGSSPLISEQTSVLMNADKPPLIYQRLGISIFGSSFQLLLVIDVLPSNPHQSGVGASVCEQLLACGCKQKTKFFRKEPARRFQRGLKSAGC